MSRTENLMAGKLTISRWTGGCDPREITIRVIDEKSGVEFVCVNVSPEELGLALTGQGHIDCSFSICGLDRIGKEAQNKIEIVPYAKSKTFTREVDRKALAALEVDGWKCRQSDLNNHHRWTDTGVSVTFFRHVGKGVLDEKAGE